MVHLEELTVDLQVRVVIFVIDLLELKLEGARALGHPVRLIDHHFESQLHLVLP